MKLLLAILLSAAAPSAWANCKPNSANPDAPGSEVSCAVRSGQCSLAADIFLGAAGDSAAAAAVLQYGKFCGRAAKCPGLNNANEAADGRNIDVDACEDNVIDASCKAHDECLDVAGLPASEPIPPPDRCPCDLALLAKLGAVAFGGLASLSPLPDFLGQIQDELAKSDLLPFDPPKDELCDDDFYDLVGSPLDPDRTYDQFLSLPFWGINLSRSSEAVLLAAPFCGLFVEGGACLFNPTDYITEYGYTPILADLTADLTVVQGLCQIISVAFL